MKLAWHYDRENKVWWAYSKPHVCVWHGCVSGKWHLSFSRRVGRSVVYDPIQEWETLIAAKRAAERKMEGRK